MPRQIQTRTLNKNKLLRAVLSLLIVYLAFLFCSQQVSIFKYKKQIKENEQRIAQEEIKDIQIKEQSTDESKLERVEKIARDELGYLKTNERLFIDASEN